MIHGGQAGGVRNAGVPHAHVVFTIPARCLRSNEYLRRFVPLGGARSIFPGREFHIPGGKRPRGYAAGFHRQRFSPRWLVGRGLIASSPSRSKIRHCITQTQIIFKIGDTMPWTARLHGAVLPNGGIRHLRIKTPMPRR